MKIQPYGSSHLIRTKETFIDLPNRLKKPMGMEDEIEADTLIQLSGGIDSTYVLWKWLKENPNKFAIVHHINLKSYEDRDLKELEAVDNILKWLDKNGLNNYFYIQSVFDYGDIPGATHDVNVCGYFAGIIFRTRRFHHTNRQHLPIYKTNSEREIKRRQLTNFISDKEVEFIYPLKGKEKWQIIEELPEELFNLTWYCRSPIDNKRCQKCFSCNDVDKSLKRIKEEKLRNFLQGF